MFKHKWLFCLLLLAIAQWVTAADSVKQASPEVPEIVDARFESLSTQDGLSQDTINDIEFDRQGFMYIATESGLDRWDGHHLKRIVGANNELKETSVNKLRVFQDLLLVGTAYKGIFILDLSSGRIVPFYSAAYQKVDSRFQLVNSLDITEAGKVLAAMDMQVARIDLESKTGQVIFALGPQDYDSGNGIRWALEAREYVFIGTAFGLVVVDPQGRAHEPGFLPPEFTHYDSKNIKHIYLDQDNTLWLATVRGVFTVSLDSAIASIEDERDIESFAVLANRNVWRVTEGQDNTFWLATDKGLFRTQKSGAQFRSEFLFEPRRGYEALSKKDLTDVVVDNTGNLWMGTKASGIIGWSPLSEEFRTLKNTSVSEASQNVLTDNGIWSIAEGAPGTLWIGTENGLNLWDLQTGKVEQWNKGEYTLPFDKHYIEKLFVIDESTLIYQSGEGYWHFDTEAGKSFRLTTKHPEDQILVDEYLSGSALITKDNVLWFASDRGFFAYGLNDKTVSKLPLPQSMNPTFFHSFLGISEALGGKMLMSMMGSLYAVDPISFAVEKIHALGAENEALDVYPGSWVVDKRNVMWVSYPGHSLVGLDASSFEQKYVFDASTPLGTDIAFGLQLDEEDNLWFSSHSGLHFIDASRNHVTHFRYGESLSISEFNQGAATQLSDGSMAYGSPSGLLHFHPKEILAAVRSRSTGNMFDAGMVITDVHISSRPSSSTVAGFNDTHLKLRHDDNGLQVRFSNMALSKASEHWYHYQLVKNGKVVSEQQTRDPVLNIPVLEPGDFRLNVFGGRGLTGNRSAKGATMTFTVAYAPWASPFAYFSYVLLLGLFFSLVYLIRQRQLAALNAAKLESSVFGEAFRQTRDGVVLLNAEREAFATNKAFNKAFGLDPSIPLSENWSGLLSAHKKFDVFVTRQLDSLTPSRSATREELMLSLNAGEDSEFLVKASMVDGSRFAQNTLYMLIFSDISEQKNTERALTQMATHDALTGLANRELLTDRLEHAIKHASHHNRQLAVMFIDLDRFKAINDSLGHGTGDALLVEISQRMTEHCAEDVTLARVGGDEFVMVVEDVESVDEVISFAHSLVNLVENPIVIANQTLRVSCSIGAAIYPHDAESPDLLLRYADMAMYSAKKGTTTPFCFYTNELNHTAQLRLKIENLVKLAHETNSFFNVYQPIVDVVTGNTAGFELLMRCEVENQVICPNEFVPVLEQLRLIVDVTKAAVSRATGELASWYEAGFKGYLSVNLSAIHVAEEIDVQFFIDCLERMNLPRSALRFEVTESALMRDKEQALAQFNRLKQAGFKLAIDDFGTGYSSLSYLNSFPLDVIKIDKTFCDDIGHADKGNGLLLTTIGMANSLDMDCIAEGVETEQQMQFLKQNGCAYHQGYHFSRPVTAAQASELAMRSWT